MKDLPQVIFPCLAYRKIVLEFFFYHKQLLTCRRQTRRKSRVLGKRENAFSYVDTASGNGQTQKNGGKIMVT